MVEFFIPGIDPAQAEATLALTAEGLGVRVPAPNERIRSITYDQNGDDFTAVVGEKLQSRTEPKIVNRKPVGRATRRTYEATVLIIFPGDPILIFTDGADHPSSWANPILVRPNRWANVIKLFDVPPGAH